MCENQKPFACAIQGCGMTFTNEDHLKWHEKKHDMNLNLEISNKSNDLADQTPTPTRFIRNCEEVGLFQDLQNVNPFDEVFKKALTRNGSLAVESSSEETLHTPHILPHHIENNTTKYVTASNNAPIEFHDMSQETPNSPQNIPLIVVDNDTDEKPTLVNKTLDKNMGNEKYIRCKIKEALLKNKNKDTNLKSNENKRLEYYFPEKKTDSDDKEKIREMNRAAQVRCRKRKQAQIKQMEGEVVSLKLQNKKLAIENVMLKAEITKLKEMLLKCENKGTSPENTSNNLTQSSTAMIFKLIPPTTGNMCIPILPNIKTNSGNSLHSGFPKINGIKNSIIFLQNPKITKAKNLKNIFPKTSK